MLRAIPGPVDTEFSHAGSQRMWIDSQHSSRTASPLNLTARGYKSAFNVQFHRGVECRYRC